MWNCTLNYCLSLKLPRQSDVPVKHSPLLKTRFRDVSLKAVSAKVTQLEKLRTFTAISSDTGEVDRVKVYQPYESTTNPSLILKAVQKPEYQRFLKQAIQGERANPGPSFEGRPYASIADRAAVLMGCELLEMIPGRVSTQVDPHLAYDTEATVQRSLHLINLYKEKGIPADRVYIKLASTWEGIQACKLLKEKGIESNMTLLFSFAQAVACGQVGAAMIAAYVGRILEWYKKKTGKDYSPEDDPGVKSVKRIYKYYKQYGIETKIMAASFRNVGEIQQLAGCDYITISPEHLDELKGSFAPLPRLLYPQMGGCEDAKVEILDEKKFNEMHELDEMATEQLKEGILKFSNHQLDIEHIIKTLI